MLSIRSPQRRQIRVSGALRQKLIRDGWQSRAAGTGAWRKHDRPRSSTRRRVAAALVKKLAEGAMRDARTSASEALSTSARSAVETAHLALAEAEAIGCRCSRRAGQLTRLVPTIWAELGSSLTRSMQSAAKDGLASSFIAAASRAEMRSSALRLGADTAAGRQKLTRATPDAPGEHSASLW